MAGDVLKDILETYDGKDIYNCDETGVFYKCFRIKLWSSKVTQHTVLKLQRIVFQF